MSIHAVEIVKIESVEPHPNPEVERMEVTKIWGWQCCIGKGQFKAGDKAIYVPPDYLVPTSHPLFSFLHKEGKSQERIKVRRFKGCVSQGLLVTVPEDLSHLPIGSNVISELGIERYEPPLPKSTYGQFVSGPSGLYAPKFDVENYQRYKHLFEHDEEVAITEKLHGANARFCYAADKDGNVAQFCGSRTNWMAEDDKNIWWMAYRQNKAIGDWCQANPGKIVYGEVFGQVQNLKYGAKKNDIFFAAFAVLDKNRWLDWNEFRECASSLPLAPLVYQGPFDEAMAYELAEKDSLWPHADHMREGIVILPIKERNDAEIGRVCLKIVSNRYLEKS